MDDHVKGRVIPDAAARDVQALNTFGDLDTFKTEGIVGSSCTIAKS